MNQGGGRDPSRPPENFFTFPKFMLDIFRQACYTINCSDERPGGIAQLGERLTGSQEVSGSIPLISTKEKRTSIRMSFFLWWTWVGLRLPLTNVVCGRMIKCESPDGFYPRHPSRRKRNRSPSFCYAQDNSPRRCPRRGLLFISAGVPCCRTRYPAAAQNRNPCTSEPRRRCSGPAPL